MAGFTTASETNSDNQDVELGRMIQPISRLCKRSATISVMEKQTERTNVSSAPAAQEANDNRFFDAVGTTVPDYPISQSYNPLPERLTKGSLHTDISWPQVQSVDTRKDNETLLRACLTRHVYKNELGHELRDDYDSLTSATGSLNLAPRAANTLDSESSNVSETLGDTDLEQANTTTAETDGRPCTPESVESYDSMPDLISISNSSCSDNSNFTQDSQMSNLHWGTAILGRIASEVSEKLRKWIAAHPELAEEVETSDIQKNLTDLETHCTSCLQESSRIPGAPDLDEGDRNLRSTRYGLHGEIKALLGAECRGPVSGPSRFLLAAIRKVQANVQLRRTFACARCSTANLECTYDKSNVRRDVREKDWSAYLPKAAYMTAQQSSSMVLTLSRTTEKKRAASPDTAEEIDHDGQWLDISDDEQQYEGMDSTADVDTQEMEEDESSTLHTNSSFDDTDTTTEVNITPRLTRASPPQPGNPGNPEVMKTEMWDDSFRAQLPNTDAVLDNHWTINRQVPAASDMSRSMDEMIAAFYSYNPVPAPFPFTPNPPIYRTPERSDPPLALPIIPDAVAAPRQYPLDPVTEEHKGRMTVSSNAQSGYLQIRPTNPRRFLEVERNVGFDPRYPKYLNLEPRPQNDPSIDAVPAAKTNSDWMEEFDRIVASSSENIDRKDRVVLHQPVTTVAPRDTVRGANLDAHRPANHGARNDATHHSAGINIKAPNPRYAYSQSPHSATPNSATKAVKLEVREEEYGNNLPGYDRDTELKRIFGT
ncbi:hypothetical protein B0H13DRAFT_1920954 [Mycena leptocephala]|nr:hypothetical protein B0H13DRAFT_1920954 [Mycena leptocephala]